MLFASSREVQSAVALNSLVQISSAEGFSLYISVVFHFIIGSAAKIRTTLPADSN